ncbi:Na+/H+ antiporter [Leifsonia xyli subsp. cynodontis DSM 46306]|uniref:Cation/H+ exchanger transmembrane domain-containing protein n=1 Tax=Leifsonia xyli subsp. cynodontis DSM 46306 TaxID=1389489 RepID=U3P6F5_LEIXC|nr:sodium:proton antiporter [Leifsonia xyli]AGW40497.1 Na+/H+ antiporter [Leifsonia xyli subsp. cynodontis DSM 46306]
MELGVYAVIAVAVIVGVAAFARKLGVAAPIILVVVGVTLSWLPGVPEIVVPPEVILDGLLPPILYAAAISVPLTDFRRNLAPIAGLSIVLVIITAFAVGFVLYTLLPDLDLAAAIALGAIISPPDAVAATSIGRKLGLPPRLLTVLEGEGLVNDATALVLLRTALAAAVGALTTPLAGVLDFLSAVLIALVVGLVVGFLSVWVRSKLNDPVLDTALSVIVPFAAFAPTEALHGSGVLAVVITGLYTGHASSQHFTAQARISDQINWRTIQFLLENGVFLLIGLELRTLIADVEHPEVLSVWDAVCIGLVGLLCLVAIRYLLIVPLIYFLKHRGERAEKNVLREWLMISYFRDHPVRFRWQAIRKQRAELRYERHRSDLEEFRQEAIDWRGGIVLGWSGMRGVVTLAAAQSLPADIPYRPQLILIAFTVAFVSLVLQGGTLPGLIRALGVQGIDAKDDRRLLAQLLDDLSETGLAVLDDPEAASGSATPFDPEVVERVRQTTYLGAEAAWERIVLYDEPPESRPHHVYRTLRLAVVDAERDRLLLERSRGAYPSRILSEAQAMLDIEETRLRSRAR